MTHKHIFFSFCMALSGILFSHECSAQTAAELLARGREAYMNYDFNTARKDYAAAHRKVKKEDSEFSELYNQYTRELNTASNFLERVERIAIIDSITVPRDDFFKAYHIPASSGSLGDSKALPFRNPGVNYVFTNEGDDYKLWAQADVDSTGYSRLLESSRLTDGSWSTPAPLPNLAEESDAIFPFMMSDGVTLYFADNGDDSIGGYDIMVATRDAADGSFLQPQNLGFPYNSPYDDYMLAIDELNGVGWWATDRNRLDDLITIYVFVTNDLRQNYPADQENLCDFARITDYIESQPEDADYDELLATIRSINPFERKKEAEFIFPIGGGSILTRYDEIENAALRSEMRAFQTAKSDLESAEKELDKLRREYHASHSASIEPAIERLEEKVSGMRKELATKKSSLYRLMSTR
ncbi:MAG: hypothetical protein NC204_01215 [Candidatus Amulumruptor caecigallinarius]|nr:hypothetical protein [Candidatus Amulumruptor caecigallinarius]